MHRFVVACLILVLSALVVLIVSPSASAQSGDYLGITAYNCETDPGPSYIGFGTPAPDDCAWAEGATFTVTDAEGDVVGGCTIPADLGGCSVQVPLGATITVTEEASTIPEGYAPRENPIVLETPPPPGAAGEFLRQFINVRQPAEDGATTLPTTGVGRTRAAAFAPSMQSAVLLLATVGIALLLRRASARTRDRSAPR